MAEISTLDEIAALKPFLSDERGDVRSAAEAHLLRLTEPVHFAVAGEFGSGKSTIVNLLIGTSFVETSVLANDLPPVFFRSGDDQDLFFGWWDRSELSPVPESQLEAIAELGPDYLAVNSRAPILADITIIDMPGLNDPRRDQAFVKQTIARSDALIWCTNAVSAWRESERRTCEGLLPLVDGQALLVVTHVDLKAVRDAVPRLLKRLRSAAGGHFKAILPLAAPDAAAAAKEGSISDVLAWEHSGGAALHLAIDTLAAELRAARRAAARAFLAQYPEGPERPASPPAGGSTLSMWRSGLARIVAEWSDLDSSESAAAIAGLLSDVAARLSDDMSAAWLAAECRAVAREIRAAAAGDEQELASAAAALAQIDRDLARNLQADEV